MIWPSKIRLEIPTNAPGCFLIRGVSSNKDTSADRKLARQMTLLVQMDWDFPGVAGTFGWSVAAVGNPNQHDCTHEGTDGTVACPACDLSPGAFIQSARRWLETRENAMTINPGYELYPY